MPEMHAYVCDDSDTRRFLEESSDSGKTFISKFISVKANDENDLFEQALFNSDPDKDTIVLYNGMRSVLDSVFIMNLIEKIMSIESMDVFYMYKYLDIGRYSERITTIGKIEILKTITPHGIKALILTKKGKRILKDVIRKENGRGYDFSLNAYCEKIEAYYSSPQIFFPTSSLELNTDRELVCKKSPKLHNRNKTLLNLMWLIFVIIVICVVAVMVFSECHKLDEDSSKPHIKINYSNIDGGSGIGPFDGTGNLKTYRDF